LPSRCSLSKEAGDAERVFPPDNGNDDIVLIDDVVLEIQMGYMEIPDVEDILRDAGIHEKTIFYGVEDITATNIIWQVFSVMKKLTPNIVQFFRLPANKLHGVVARVEM
jgi:KUP system potassium uptake protein